MLLRSKIQNKCKTTNAQLISSWLKCSCNADLPTPLHLASSRVASLVPQVAAIDNHHEFKLDFVMWLSLQASLWVSGLNDASVFQECHICNDSAGFFGPYI
jgi:hypothetical protein